MALRLQRQSVNVTVERFALVEVAANGALGSISANRCVKISTVPLRKVLSLPLVRGPYCGFRQVASRRTMSNLTFRAWAGWALLEAKQQRHLAAA